MKVCDICSCVWCNYVICVAFLNYHCIVIHIIDFCQHRRMFNGIKRGKFPMNINGCVKLWFAQIIRYLFTLIIFYLKVYYYKQSLVIIILCRWSIRRVISAGPRVSFPARPALGVNKFHYQYKKFNLCKSQNRIREYFVSRWKLKIAIVKFNTRDVSKE